MHNFIGSFQKNIERSFLTFLVSLCIVYFLKDTLSQFILMGKSLSGRNPGLQIVFLVILFCIIFSFLLFLFGRQLDWLIHNYAFSTGIISLIPLVAYSIIGSFSRFVADDFSSATLAVSKGVIGATWDWYIHWSGRFSASFLDSLTGYIGPGVMPFITGSVILVWLVALMSIARHFFQTRTKLNRFALSMFLSAWVLTTTFEVTPLLSQSLYWGQGMRSVILPLILGTLLISILYYLIHIKKSSPANWLVLVGVVSFIAGGFGETYVVLQTTGYFLLLLLIYFENPDGWQKNVLPVILVGVLGSILAMGITIAAPGNKIRQSYFPPSPDLFNLLKISALSFWGYIQFLGNAPVRVVNLAVLFLAGVFSGGFQKNNPIQMDRQLNNNYRISNFINNSCWKTVLFLSSLSLILLYVCFVPAAYGMSTSPPERTLVIPTFLLALYVSVLGIVSGRYLPAFFQTKIQNLLPSRTLKLTGWIIFLLFSFYSLNISNNTLIVLPDYRHFADVFDRADAMIRQARAEGKKSVMVPEVHNYFGLSDFGAGTTYWLDEAVNSYYGIPVIVNKHMK